jgi:glutathione peroxidase
MLVTLTVATTLACTPTEVNKLDSMKTEPVASRANSIYEFKSKTIDGKEIVLDKFKGKVLLVVNTASRCGLTTQYKGLEALYQKYKDQNFVILGFPANNFNGQEPGSNEEIAKFCSTEYNVTFPMFSKISVGGDDIDPLYQWLIDSSDRKEPIEWNFAKFIVNRQGRVVARFAPKLAPDSPEIVATLESELKKD